MFASAADILKAGERDAHYAVWLGGEGEEALAGALGAGRLARTRLTGRQAAQAVYAALTTLRGDQTLGEE